MLRRVNLFMREPRNFKHTMCTLMTIVVLCFASLGFISGYAVRNADVKWSLEVERHKFDVLASVLVEQIPEILHEIVNFQQSVDEQISTKEQKIEDLNLEIEKIRNMNTPSSSSQKKSRPKLVSPAKGSIRLKVEDYRPRPLTEKELEELYRR